MVGVEEGREFRFRGDLYSQESTFPLVKHEYVANLLHDGAAGGIYGVVRTKRLSQK